MAKNELKKVRLKSGGDAFKVYKSSTRKNAWVDDRDCFTIYQTEELDFVTFPFLLKKHFDRIIKVLTILSLVFAGIAMLSYKLELSSYKKELQVYNKNSGEIKRLLREAPQAVADSMAKKYYFWRKDMREGGVLREAQDDRRRVPVKRSSKYVPSRKSAR